jgi:hypothetical protein
LRAPPNTFVHVRAFPGADFREVVRPNFDTLYSSAFVDVTHEPIIVSTPNTNGRYYLLPMLDMWSDVFAVPGKRTSGTEAAHFAIVNKKWNGKLPPKVERIEAPTPWLWIIGRTQTDGASDYEAVHQIQNGYKLTPLSQWGKTPKPFAFKNDKSVDMKTPALKQVNSMPAKQYFAYAAELLKNNPPHLTDWSQIERLKRLGIEPGKSFDWNKVHPTVRNALDRAVTGAQKVMRDKAPTLATVVNGWQMNTNTMGVYGDYYLKRAIVAMVGLGANQPEDAIYPLAIADSTGKPLDGKNSYVLHFNKADLPPVGAFWSVTMYDAEGFPVQNPLNRFAIGDRSDLTYNADGSLDIYIQHDSPGKDKESNWLPAPPNGALGITMRLYAPALKVLDGRWAPPPLIRVNR